MKVLDALNYLFFPPKCISCGRLLGKNVVLSPLCNECEQSLKKERMRKCKYCGKEIDECICSSKSLADAGCLFHIKTAFYSANERESVADRIVFKMKNRPNPLVFDYVAKELSINLKCQIEKALEESGAESSFITYPPRSGRAVREFGHDQAKLLAKSLSKELSVPLIKTVKRGFNKNIIMKNLSHDERFVMADKAYLPLNKNSELKDKLAIIVDDVITSGATTLAISKILKKKSISAFAVVSFGAVEKLK